VSVAVSVPGTSVRSDQSIPLRGEDQRHFAGYMDLPTSGIRPLGGWENVRVELRIRDNAGLQSQPRTHEVVIGAAVSEPIPPKWNHAANHHLGTIQVDFEGGRERRWPKRRG